MKCMSKKGCGNKQGVRIIPLFLTFLILSLITVIPVGAYSEPTKIMKSNLTFSSLNCNSLNCSIASKSNQILKINGITKLGTDIILISDLKLSTRNLISSADEVKKLFACNLYDSYDLIYNSQRNKRGVGILINKKIVLDIEDTFRDAEENTLLIKATYKGEKIIIGSIYGPNDTNPLFFETIKGKIQQWYERGAVHVVLGGD
jgi:exonuclease III